MRRTIFIIVGLFLFCHAFSQERASLKIECPLVKRIEFKDTILKKDKEMYHKCQTWKLTCEEVYKIFSLAKSITSEEKSGLYYWLPCYFRTKVLFKGSIYTMEINAASFIVLYNSKSTLYFGCPSEDCKKFFILPGEDASED